MIKIFLGPFQSKIDIFNFSYRYINVNYKLRGSGPMFGKLIGFGQFDHKN